MKDLDFIIFYEHENRELENLMLLRAELITRGYSVEICHHSGCGYGRNFLFSKPNVIVVPWLRYDDNIYKFTRFKNNKKKIINLQWEQIYSEEDLKHDFVNITGLSKNANHICWGDNSKNRLINDGISESNIRVTGAIQLDFGNERFNRYYVDKSELAKEFNLNENVKWNLYISSFSFATYDETAINDLKEKWGYLSELVDITKISRVKTLEWIDDLLNIDKETIFIYRPHPSENIDEVLLEYERKYENFRIIKKYSVKQWIKVCELINTWYSTSIAEVYCMNKRCNILRPIPIPLKFELEIMKNAYFVTEKDEFIKKNTEDIDSDFPVSKEDINSYYSLVDDYPAYKRVADYLIEILKSDAYAFDYKFTKEQEDTYKEQFKNIVITSLLSDFYACTGIKLSKIIPIRKDVFENIENRFGKFYKNIGTLSKKISAIMGDSNEK